MKSRWAGSGRRSCSSVWFWADWWPETLGKPGKESHPMDHLLAPPGALARSSWRHTFRKLAQKSGCKRRPAVGRTSVHQPLPTVSSLPRPCSAPTHKWPGRRRDR